MAKNLNTLFLYHVALAVCLLTFVTLGFVITWAILFLQQPNERKRPGINIREL